MKVRDRLKQSFWQGKDPFAERSAFRGRVDLQGWASENPLLVRAIREVKPEVVVEVGVWKGGSVITMGKAMLEEQIDGAIVAVDTWLGASDHWYQPIWFEHLRIEAGFPTLFRTFAANIFESGLQDIVIPLPLDSLNAADLFSHHGLTIDVLHIDGGHAYESVLADLRSWWPLLRTGGVLIGDDYHPVRTDMWPGVRRAFHEFFSVDALENLDGKCWIKKQG